MRAVKKKPQFWATLFWLQHYERLENV